MRSLILASITLLAIGALPAMAKPTATEISWNMRAVLAPRVSVGVERQAPPQRLAPDLPRTARADGHRQHARPLS